jgi:hypothetical protein
MGKLEASHAEDKIAEKGEIEVEGAGTVGNGGDAIAAEGEFELEQGREKRERRKRGFDGDDGVEEMWLIDEADGGGGVERRASSDAAGSGEAREGRRKRSLRRAGGAGKVSAERDDGKGHLKSSQD